MITGGGRNGFLLMPFDATVLFVAGALAAVCVLDRSRGLFPEGTMPGQVLRYGLLTACACFWFV